MKREGGEGEGARKGRGEKGEGRLINSVHSLNRFGQ